MGLEGNSALVAASSSGLGRAAAVALADRGADVAICARGEDRLADAQAAVDAAGDGDVVAVPTDITDPDEVEALVDATVEEFGGLDHLVTSAGGPPSGAFLDTTERDWYEAYDLLVMSAVRLTKAAHPHLVESDAGTVVNVASTTVREVVDGMVLSNAVRRGVVGLMKTQAREWAPAVRVNAVLPGSHETPRIRELVEQAVERGEYDSYEEGLADRVAEVPMDRIGDPRELGEVVAFLSSDRASYVNGAAVPVDGGRLRS